MAYGTTSLHPRSRSPKGGGILRATRRASSGAAKRNQITDDHLRPSFSARAHRRHLLLELVFARIDIELQAAGYPQLAIDGRELIPQRPFTDVLLSGYLDDAHARLSCQNLNDLA